MRAAETGHLVISTVHAPDKVSAVERGVNFFPPEHSLSIRQQLLSCLVGVVFQVLVPDKQQGGNTIAMEALLNNMAMKHLIKEGRYNIMENVPRTGRSQGMYKLKDNLTALAEKGIIDGQLLPCRLRGGFFFRNFFLWFARVTKTKKPDKRAS